MQRLLRSQYHKTANQVINNSSLFSHSQAILVCRAQRAHPTFTTIAEIAVLASPLIPNNDVPEEGQPAPAWAPALGLAMVLARGFAPAVVVAQGVRLVATLVQKREKRQEGGKFNDSSTDGGWGLLSHNLRASETRQDRRNAS